MHSLGCIRCFVFARTQADHAEAIGKATTTTCCNICTVYRCTHATHQHITRCPVAGWPQSVWHVYLAATHYYSHHRTSPTVLTTNTHLPAPPSLPDRIRMLRTMLYGGLTLILFTLLHHLPISRAISGSLGGPDKDSESDYAADRHAEIFASADPET